MQIVYEYDRDHMILNAHTSQINLIAKIDDTFFATAASKEFKVWRCYECLVNVPNAHMNTILCMKVLERFNSCANMIATGSKDKQMKFWNY